MREIVADVQTWGVFSQDKGYAFNGYAVSSEDGTVLIDPSGSGEDGWGTVELLDPFAGVWLTNRNTAAPRPPPACFSFRREGITGRGTGSGGPECSPTQARLSLVPFRPGAPLLPWLGRLTRLRGPRR